MKITLLIISIFTVLDATSQTRNLSYYQEHAIVTSPLINETSNNNKLILLDIQQTKIILSKPQINVEASILFAPIISHDDGNKFQIISDGNVTDYTGYDLGYSDGGQYQAVVSITQPLLMGSRFNAYAQKANVATQLNENNIKLTEHELEQLVNHQYILCIRAKKQYEVSKLLSEKLQAQIITMEKLVEHAIYKQTDLLLMQIEAESYRLEYQNFITDYQNSLLDLNLLCGINDTSLVEIEDTDFRINMNRVNQSQFLTKFKLDSLTIETEQLIFNQKYKPQINLFANAGMNAIYVPAFNRFGFATGVNFSWNIFDGNQKKLVNDKSIIQLETIEFEKQHFIVKNRVFKNKFLTQIKAVDNKISIVQNQLEEYKKLVELYNFELSQAQVSVMDFKNLIRDISAKKQENITLIMQKQALISSYNYWNF